MTWTWCGVIRLSLVLVYQTLMSFLCGTWLRRRVVMHLNFIIKEVPCAGAGLCFCQSVFFQIRQKSSSGKIPPDPDTFAGFGKICRSKAILIIFCSKIHGVSHDSKFF